MRAAEFLIESLEGSRLYHYTRVYAANKILQQQSFMLTTAVGSHEETKLRPNEQYNYYLSTTRSKVGDYHRYVPYSGVMFVLDRDYYKKTHPIKPVDYWGGMHVNTERTRESEDRIYSKTPNLDLGGVIEAHVLINPKAEPVHTANVREFLILAKRSDLKTYIYTDDVSWRLQNKSKSVSQDKIIHLLRGSFDDRKRSAKRSPLNAWLELIFKNDPNTLSEKAKKLKYNLTYYSNDQDLHLSNDLFNARKPSADDYEYATKITDYMTKNKIISPKQLVRLLREKWTNQ